MPRRIFVITFLTICAFLALGFFVAQPCACGGFGEQVASAAANPTAGSLEMVSGKGDVVGLCPLKHTDVQAGISGFIARVNVTQEFINPSADAVEAVYTFPLPQDSAVDDMTITIGGRTIRSDIKRREEARKIYEQALQQGHTAALLNQQRPNIFVQRVGNIPPGEAVRVQIAFSSRLKYEDGTYEFAFPMVVAPRYIPGTPTGANGGGFAPDTTKVPDASQITPMPVKPGMRAGHDISMSVLLDAGVPIQDVSSALHDIDVERPGSTSAVVRLKNHAEIPNRDFILRYKVAGSQISDGLITHVRKSGDGYFSLVLQPPERFPEYDVAPKELVFVLDTSGSMSGFPIETGKQLISAALDELYPGDTFNLITFSGDTRILFDKPVYPTAENIAKAKALLNAQMGYGGTEMMKAIRAALAPSDSADRVRVVCFVTDGEVGNDMAIIGEVQKHPNARVFSFGIGHSVNQFLLDNIAKEGRGEAQYVMLADNASAVAKRLYEHLRAPLLTDITIDWSNLPVHDMYPQRIPDVFAGRPVVITGRFDGAMNGVVRITGKRAGQPYEREMPVNLPAEEKQNAVLASLWAREQIDDLMSQDWRGAQLGTMKPGVQEAVTKLGLDYRLLTQFTSFVAVEDRVVNKNGRPTTIQVPAEMPDGMSYEGVFGRADVRDAMKQQVTFSSRAQYANVVPAPPAQLSTQSSTVSVSGATQTVEVTADAVNNNVIQTSPGAPPIVVNPNLPQVGGSAGGLVQHKIAPAKPEAMPWNATAETPPRPIDRKLHPSLVSAFDCAEARTTRAQLSAGCNTQREIVAVEIVLTSDSEAIRKALADAGLKLTPGKARRNVVRGTIAAANLAKLVEIEAVRFVGPAPVEAARK